MKFTLTRADLARGLAAVYRIVERRNTIPILSNVKLEAEPGCGRRLHITATDLGLMAETAIPAEIVEPGATTVAAALLSDYVKRLPDKAELRVETDAEKNQLVFRSGRSRAALSTIDARDFPNFDAGTMTTTFSLPGKDLAALFGAVEFAISAEETRFYLNGIYLHPADATTLRAVSTDGFKLGRKDMPCPAGAETLPGIIVPSKAVAEFKRLAIEAGEADVTIAASEAKIRIETGDTRIVSKLIDATFPDYQRIIPAGHAVTATLDAAELASAIDRVSAIADGKGRKVVCAFGRESLVMTCRNETSSDTEEEVGCDKQGGDVRIAFNPRFATEILSALDADTVAIEMNDPGSAMVWRSSADTSRLYLLMPVRA